MSASLPLVGVVIPVYDDWPGLLRCLEALAAQTYPRERLRVRVVDNGSSDWPSQPTFPLPVEVLACPQPGSYRARNRACHDWPVEVLAFTDADCRPAPTWLEQGVGALLHHGRGHLIAGAVVLTARDPLGPSLGEQLDQIVGFRQEHSVRRGHYGATANLLVWRDLWLDLGGFSEQAFSGGDRDFCERAHRAGHQLHYNPVVRVAHPARDADALARKQQRIVGGRLRRSPGAPWGVLLGTWRPLVGEMGLIARYPGLNLARRLRLVGLAVAIRGAATAEWWRLRRPGAVPLR